MRGRCHQSNPVTFWSRRAPHRFPQEPHDHVGGGFRAPNQRAVGAFLTAPPIFENVPTTHVPSRQCIPVQQLGGTIPCNEDDQTFRRRSLGAQLPLSKKGAATPSALFLLQTGVPRPFLGRAFNSTAGRFGMTTRYPSATYRFLARPDLLRSRTAAVDDPKARCACQRQRSYHRW
jgi:hypothetical protein